MPDQPPMPPDAQPTPPPPLTPAATGTDASLTDPNAIVPNQPPGDGSQLPISHSSAAESSEKRRKTNLRYQEIRIQADKDFQVVKMRAKADKAGSMEDRRAAFREYYRLLFAKMKQIDPSLTEKCGDMQNAYLRRLAQLRLEPTIPNNPPPTPDPVH